MPKFYRQNKKRIDPRYFLEETVDRDNSIEEYYGYGEYSWGPGGTTSYGNNDYDRQATRKKQMAFNAQNFLERLKKLNNRTSPAEVAKQALSALINKVENTAQSIKDPNKPGPRLSDDEYNQLDAAMKDESSIRAFDTRVLAMLSAGPGDADGDGSSDAEELMQIAQSMQSDK